MDLAKCGNRVVEVMKHQRHDRSVDGLVGEPVQGVAKIVDPKVGHTAYSLTSKLYQLCAAIEANDVGPPMGQLGRIQTGAAADVQDPTPRHVTEQTQHGRTVVVGVVSTVFSVSCEGIGEVVVHGHRGRLTFQPHFCGRQRSAGFH